MPTINQLPAAANISASDLIPISQGGSTCAIAVGALLATTQPAILVDPPCLLGRISIGTGGPDAIHVGSGLSLSAGTITATTFDFSQLSSRSLISSADQVLISNGLAPELLSINALRGIFAPGANISIDTNGTISATAAGSALPQSIAVLPRASALAQNDLVGVSQAGEDHGITYQAFLDGLTIDLADVAAQATDTDTFWVSQTTNAMKRQSLSAIWNWVMGKLPLWKRSTLELTINTTLDPTSHNNAILVCSAPVIISGSAGILGSGFSCEVVNASSGNVLVGSDIISSNGTGIVSPNQCASLYCVSYSTGAAIFASITSSATAVSPPGQISSVSLDQATATSAIISWTVPPQDGLPVSYQLGFRVTGSTVWSMAGTTSGQTMTITGLQPSTSYDIIVTPSNIGGAGPEAPILTFSTQATAPVPGPPANVAVTNITANSASCSWSAPTSGGGALTYTVNFQISGAATWTASATGLSGTTAVISGLTAATTYNVQVIASNAQGAGVPSATATVTTTSAAGSVSNIAWNVGPSGSFTHGTGAIGVNAHVTPATVPVQFGFSTSAIVPPSAWVAAVNVNTNLWGAYVAVPSAPGTWFGWAEGVDSSCPTVFPTSFTVV